ncbi:hypothetical protein ILYODFUR_014562 [Ilyodon furcidens]|uniref:Uncharacterized protein n=1 Tax=Ilyodon furcidens TaxID=33524 RepID=A0ABV0T044_9TELE
MNSYKGKRNQYNSEPLIKIFQVYVRRSYFFSFSRSFIQADPSLVTLSVTVRPPHLIRITSYPLHALSGSSKSHLPFSSSGSADSTSSTPIRLYHSLSKLSQLRLFSSTH